MDKNNLKLINSALEDNRAELIRLLQDLIRIRSYSGDEEQIVKFTVDRMNMYGFDKVYIDKLGNAIGCIGNGPVTLLYDAHIDTVVVTESENWQYPPFEGKISNGCIYGRGAVDEKPALAGYLIAAKILKSINIDLPFRICIVGSVLEEDCDGYPLMHLIENENIKPDYVLLGEPTDLSVYRGQRGRMEMEIIARGKSAHGAHNQEGINAIYKMNPVISEIEKLDLSLPPAEPLGKGSVTVSQLVTQAPSLCSVPDYCRIHIDRRLTKGETKDSALKELSDICGKVSADFEIEIPEYKGKSWTGRSFNQEAYFPTWVFDEDHVLVRAGIEAAKLAGGKSEKSGTWGFSTNGVATAGRLNIPTIGFAPGLESLAHTSREKIKLDDLVTATRFYALFPFILNEFVNKK